MRTKSIHAAGAFLIFGAFALGGCGGDAGGETEKDGARSQETPAQGAAERDAPVPAASVVDQAVKSLSAMDVAKLRYDHVASRPNGRGQERQAYFEILGTDMEDAVRLVTETLAGVGYERTERTGEAGNVRLVFGKEGEPELRLHVRSREVHPKLKDPDATLSVYLTQQI